MNTDVVDATIDLLLKPNPSPRCTTKDIVIHVVPMVVY